MDKRIRDIYLIYLGLNENIEILSLGSNEELWYKGNIIEISYIVELLENLK